MRRCRPALSAGAVSRRCHAVPPVTRAGLGTVVRARPVRRVALLTYYKELLNVRVQGMSHEAKTGLLAQFCRVAKALGNPARLELLDLLTQAERSVEDLAAVAGMPVGNTSAQLRALHAAGLVTSRRNGTRIYYRISGDDVAALYRAMREVARTHLPDAEAARSAYLGNGDGEPAEPVGRSELMRRAAAGEVLVIDVRPAAEYAAGHIPGAVSIPLEDLPARLGTLADDGTEIVAYCRGSYCVLARDAVRQLRSAGRRARHLADGMLEWRLDGLPVEAALPAAGSLSGAGGAVVR